MLHHSLFSQQIDAGEHEDLKSFFHTLLTKSEFGYTLFGDKPLSFYSYFTKLLPGGVSYGDLLEIRLEKHFILYEKYKHLFNTKNFLLLDQPFISSKFPTSGYTRDIIIINKPAFIKVVNEHHDIFHQCLGYQTTGEKLLHKIEKGRLVLSDVLQENELLWGIVLGFGTHNAKLYARREEMENYSLVLSEGFKTADEEWEYIQDHLTGFTHEYCVDLISLPLFMSDASHKETKELKKKYKRTQEKLVEIYKSPDFTNLILKQLPS